MSGGNTQTTVNTNNHRTTNAVNHQINNTNIHNVYNEENTHQKYHEGNEYYGDFDDVSGTINVPGAVMRITLGELMQLG